MKKLIFILLPLLFIGCKNTISYELKNNTCYDVVLIDENNVNKTEYFLKANTALTIDHFDSGHFSIKDNNYPVEVYNSFNYCEINYLSTIFLTIYNNSNNELSMKIINATYQPSTIYTIPGNYNQTLSIYCNTIPQVSLFFENNTYNNYVLKDNTLIIF